MSRTCPFTKEVVNALLKERAPICFHCGKSYIKDFIHCGETYSTWMPNCDCINKPTIRIMTGYKNESDNDCDNSCNN